MDPSTRQLCDSRVFSPARAHSASLQGLSGVLAVDQLRRSRGSVRNSSSYSCPLRAPCAAQPTINRHIERMHNVLKLNRSHADGVQILKYEAGGFYLRHSPLRLHRSGVEPDILGSGRYAARACSPSCCTFRAPMRAGSAHTGSATGDYRRVRHWRSRVGSRIVLLALPPGSTG